MRDMAHELEDHPVSVMSAWPGIVRTEFAGGMFEQAPETLGFFPREAWATFPGQPTGSGRVEEILLRARLVRHMHRTCVRDTEISRTRFSAGAPVMLFSTPTTGTQR